MGFGIWDFEIWVLGFRGLAVRVWRQGLWVVGCGLWVVSCGLWVVQDLGAEIRVMGLGFKV